MILIDSNEVSTAPLVFLQVRNYFGAEAVMQANLPFGDIAFTLPGGRILRVERKTPGDFASSIADGRLAKQVNDMTKNDNSWPAVVVTGHFVYDENDFLVLDNRVTRWYGASIRAAIRSVQWAGALYEECEVEDYPRVLDELARLAGKPSHAHYQAPNKSRRPVIDFYPEETIRQAKIEFLMGLPGVGVKMATSLLDWCGLRDHSRDGSIAECLEWITAFPEMSKTELPSLWSCRKAKILREFLTDHDNVILLTREVDSEITTPEQLREMIEILDRLPKSFDELLGDLSSKINERLAADEKQDDPQKEG